MSETRGAAPSAWYPIAVLLVVINLLGGGYAIGQGEPGHAAIHGVLVLALGAWARWLRRGPGGGERGRRVEGVEALEALEADVDRLRQELSETQERLDFAERLLAQRPEPGREKP